MIDDRERTAEKGLEVTDGSEALMPEGEIEILSIDGGPPEAEPGEPPVAEPAMAPAEAASGLLTEELAAARERHVRLLADFDNFRKRIDREREDLRRHALFEMVRDLLPVADNLERALAAQGSPEDLRRGVEMILRQLHDGLRKLGVSEVPALGERFDPRVHEAVAHRHDASVDGPRVAAELQRGYRLHERLLRPALVVVAAPPEGGEVAAQAAAAVGQADAEEAPRTSEPPTVGK